MTITSYPLFITQWVSILNYVVPIRSTTLLPLKWKTLSTSQNLDLIISKLVAQPPVLDYLHPEFRLWVHDENAPLAGGIIHWVFLMLVNNKRTSTSKGRSSPSAALSDVLFALLTGTEWPQPLKGRSSFSGGPLALMKSDPTTHGGILHQPFALSFAKLLSTVLHLLLIWKEGYI